MAWPTAPIAGTAAGCLAAAAGVLASVHSRLDPWWLWVPAQAVGLSFVTAGTVAWLRRPANGTGRLLTAVGVTWYLTDLRYSVEPALFAIGFSLFYLSPVIFTHMVLALPSGRLSSRAARRVAAGLYLDVLVSQTMRYLTEHPRPPQSWTTPGATYSAWAPIGSVTGLLLTLVAIGLVLRRWRRAGRPARRTHALAWITGAAVGLVVFVTILASLSNASADVHRRLAVAYLAGLILTPFAITAGVLKVRIARMRVADLAVRLEETREPGQLRGALADALGDPTLVVCFRAPDSGGYLDADGRTVEITHTGDRAVTPVRRRGEQLAVLVHDPTLLDQRPLVDAVVAVARLALDNARLHAAERARLEQVRASRARILAAADAERHRIQRDLHDGVQQKLLAVSMLVAQACAGLPAPDGTAGPGMLLAEARAQLRDVIRELRELTAGIYPPALSEQGLAAAVETIAERAAVPVLFKVPAGRWPDRVERTAYFVINEALANVYKHSAAGRAWIHVIPADRVVLVRITDDGAGGADPDLGTGLRGLRDRVAAIGGTLRIHSRTGVGTRVEAELPCES